ncbi:unnamed protein product [Parnassius apollo]|uniref:(apollo) hypothetical protein n=1 Tax=Parnassius apollo TaxID=110799 RepID=A0A8S3WN45_PARAO|nr:unnamed protein product [Parnassius apollo]
MFKGVKDVTRMSPEWYAMAGEKLTLVIKSLVLLSTHEHVKIRKELAVLSARILRECNASMQPSIPVVLDILISLAKDEYPELFEYCTSVVNAYFTEASQEKRLDTMDCLCENFLTTLTNLPRILNNIDSGRKLAALNLMHGYVRVLSDGSRPQRLTTAMTSHTTLDALCEALRHAAALSTDLTLLATHADRELTAPPPTTTPWRILRHLDTKECEQRLRDICQLLAEAECAELLLDHLLELFQQRECEVAYIMNCFGSAPNSSPTLVKRILDTYLEEDVWYLPLEVCSSETPVTKEETLDVEVYNPRAWMKDSVPGLFEGATETRYTGISYAAGRHSVASGCSSVAAAQRNAELCCLLTEGVGALAFTLRDHFQPYLLKTLCLVLERVGSRYELLHLAGLKAINDIARACGHSCVAELIAANADYLTSQITNRLKKAWNIKSALEILSVVMEYSDTRILDYLYGIVDDVLVQSCDKFHERDLYAYLQVFLTFITRIRKWFHVEEDSKTTPHNRTENFSVLKDVIEFAKNKEEAERLLSKEEFEEDSGKSVEEMYREDLKKKEEDVLDYDDRVTYESPPLPRHVTVTVSILKRCINFITSKQRDDAILALKVLSLGLPILKHHENELLPLVHLTWAPLCTKVGAEPAVARAALDLLVTMATLSKDFIRNRAMKDVFPHMYKYLRSSSHDSLLKDRGSTYRLSPAYRLQEAMLAALPGLVVDLSLDEAGLEEAMSCVDTYLSKKQPKPLQGLAVIFFKHILASNYGAVWCHLRKLCANDDVIEPPAMKYIKLEPVVGTPYRSTNVDCEKNIKLIFEID